MIRLRDVDNDLVCGAVQEKGDFAGAPAYVIGRGRSGEVPFARLTCDMARALAADLLAFADSTPETMENEG